MSMRKVILSGFCDSKNCIEGCTNGFDILRLCSVHTFLPLAEPLSLTDLVVAANKFLQHE